MLAMISLVLAGLLKLLVVAGAAVYAGLVLMSYRTDGPHSALRLDLFDPARSAERLVVWLGVKAVAAVLRIGGGLFGALSEASAEVGEWFIRRRDPEVQAAVRSRFMI
jgi:hypothetical protein